MPPVHCLPGLSTSEEALQPIRDFVNSERIAKTGGSRKAFQYDLGVFGLDEAALRAKFEGIG